MEACTAASSGSSSPPWLPPAPSGKRGFGCTSPQLIQALLLQIPGVNMDADSTASPPPVTCPHPPAPGRAVLWGTVLPFITVSRQSPRATLVNDQSDTNRWCRQRATGAPGSAVSLTPSQGRDLAGLRVPGKNTVNFHPPQARPGQSAADAGAASLMRPAGDRLHSLRPRERA